MSKFGELIDGDAPLLLVFFKEMEEMKDEFFPALKDVVAALGDHGKVIKIRWVKSQTCGCPGGSKSCQR